MWEALTGRTAQRYVCLSAILAILWYSEVDWGLTLCTMALVLVIEFLAQVEGMNIAFDVFSRMGDDKLTELKRLLKEEDDKK